MDYQNFDLTIDHSEGDYYKAQAKAPNGKEATKRFRLPFEDDKFDHFWQKLGVDSRGARREGASSKPIIPMPDLESAIAFGGRLFNAIFEGELQNCLRSSLDENDAPGKGLRIRLRLKAPELEGLPWEYLYDPEPRDRFFALSVRTPIVRFPELPEQIRLMPAPRPLRILVMIGSHAGLDVDRERKRMEKALGGLEREGVVNLEFMNEATLAALQEQLLQDEYHVFHFIGHGEFNQVAGEGQLLFDGPEGPGKRVTGRDLGLYFRDHDSLRLAILNACEGAVAASDNAFAGVAQKLIQQRLPSVIAMQREITDDAAIAFAGGFYRAIARGYQIEAALAYARMAVYAQHNYVEWGIPVLFSHALDGRLFEASPAGSTYSHSLLQPPSTSGTCKPVPEGPPNTPPGGPLGGPPGEPYKRNRYVHRSDEEQEAFDYLSNPGQPVVIWGPARFGKTWLFEYLLDHLRQPREVCQDHPELCGEPCQIISFDIKWIDHDARSSPDLLLLELARQIATPVAKAVKSDAEKWVSIAWRRSETPILKIKWLLEQMVLPQIKGTLILAIDRADIIWGWPCQDDFFYALRVMAAASGGQEEPWSKLRMLLTVSTTPTNLTRDVFRSPFNLAPPIRLRGFHGKEQIEGLARLYQLDWTRDEGVRGLIELVDGHPYLIRLAMYKSARHSLSLRLLTNETDLHNSIFDEHLSEILGWLHEYNLVEAVKNILRPPASRLNLQEEERFKQEAELLRKAGLVKREHNSYRLRCKLYESYLRSEL
jgi:AAA-like domain/CHAT domain